MRRLARWHIWLGWLIGVPLLLWTFSGLWMVARPIEEVRGTDLRSEPARLPAITAPVLPATEARPVERIELVQRVDGPVWIVRFAGGDARAASVASGRMLPRIDAALARRIADAALAEPSAVVGASAFAAVDAPLELRRDRSSWQVRYADGVHVYVDALTGEVLAVRTGQWRWFDLMWGLHIMDLQTREDTHHPLLIGFAALAFAGSLMGVVLLFWRRKARVRGAGTKG
ncbi:PepSY domain-containing protein [Sphingomonas lacunae]|uniref:PepSY domain-containing protein n=2 Tax=Sphingomonas lacunae TaxID=2698828 RepID=A0A6M4AWT8_9SPHN|nr:PepSY domain-containing protein [Sphingomonas lacunae]